MCNVAEVIAENIKMRRRELGLTQGALAALLGYSEKAVSKWECGRGVPPTELLPRLAKCLETSVDRLLAENGLGEQLFLGIDGGGTKTDFALADKHGNLIKRVILGASNPNDVGFAATQDVLRNGIAEVCDGYSMNSISVFAGLAGCSSKDNAQKVYDFLSRFGFAKVMNGEDAQNAVVTGLDGNDGISVIMGTGSVVYAKQGENLYRIGGYGYLLGDAGSGFAIGRDVILSALRYEDGSGKDTLLYKYVKEACGGETVFEKIEDFYKGGKRTVAKYSPLAFRAYAEGDPVAREIIAKNLEELAQLIGSAAKKLCGDRIKVVLGGGITAESDTVTAVLSGFLSNGKRSFDIEVCEKPMVWGSLRLAGMPEKEFDALNKGW